MTAADSPDRPGLSRSHLTLWWLMSTPAEHWDRVYSTGPVTGLSSFQADATTSIRLLSRWAAPADALLDLGAGASSLVDSLIDAHWTDLTLLDVSQVAIDVVRRRIGQFAPGVRFICADFRRWKPDRRYRTWHDRAVFHFLVEPSERDAYVSLARRSVSPGGVVIVSTFADDGPEFCSGLATARFDAERLAALFGSGFRLQHAEREEHVTPAGVVQPFTWVVLRRVDGADQG